MIELLNKEVTYIRQNKDGVQEGTAILKGIGLNTDNRPYVLLKAGDEAFNTFLACINQPPEFHERFKELCTKTQAISAEGTEKQKALVAEYNAKIAGLDDELLGPCIGEANAA